jgi:hypothetical protein
LPASTRTEPGGSEMEAGPANSPGPTTLRSLPKRMAHSARKETVQKGRAKSRAAGCSRPRRTR